MNETHLAHLKRTAKVSDDPRIIIIRIELTAFAIQVEEGGNPATSLNTLAIAFQMKKPII
jgi:hypothetical protein